MTLREGYNSIAIPSGVSKRTILLACTCLILAAFTVCVYVSEQGDDSDADDVSTYKITFDLNGGSGSISGITPNTNNKYALPTPTNATAPSGSKFLGWGSSASTKAADVTSGEQTATADKTWYAIWGYDLTFDMNGGSGSQTKINAAIGETVSLPANKLTAPSGKTFAG